MLKNNVIHGVGEALVLDFLTGREVLRLTRMESTSWTVAFEEQNVQGGDDLDIFENFETSRTQKMAFQNNEFDMRMLEVATGKRPVATLSAPIQELSEGILIPATPFSATLKHATAVAGSILVQFSDSREKLAPKPDLPVGSVAEVVGTGFSTGDTVVCRITSIVNGRESIASVTREVTIGAATAGVAVQLPSGILAVDAKLAQYDYELDGFNVYVDDGTNPEYKSNSTPVAPGAIHTVVVSPGAGAGAPATTPTTTGQFSISGAVITFASVDSGKGVLVDYVWTTSSTVYQAEVVDILSNCLRQYVKIVLRQKYTSKDGTVMGFQAVIHKAKYTGDFTLESTRADAAKHSMEFNVFDPERADSKIVSLTKFDLGVAPTC